MTLTHARLFGLVMFWTIATTVFAWLPLARILGKPEGYTWGLFGISGAGTEGPYWIFIVLTTFALTMLFTGFRGPRRLFYPMLLLWHLTLTGAVVSGAVMGGSDAVWQGQGLHFALPLILLVVPFVLFTALIMTWVVRDVRLGGLPPTPPWQPANTRRLVASLVLVPVALLLFRAGTNYDWVTAAAIIVSIIQWILLAESFAPAVARKAVASRA